MAQQISFIRAAEGLVFQPVGQQPGAIAGQSIHRENGGSGIFCMNLVNNDFLLRLRNQVDFTKHYKICFGQHGTKLA